MLTHYRASVMLSRARCGRPWQAVNTTHQREAVTCALCLRFIAKDEAGKKTKEAP